MIARYLRQRTYDWSDPRCIRLKEILATIYHLQQQAIDLLNMVSMRLAQINLAQSADEFWPQILNKAAAQRRMERLIVAVLDDPGAMAYHDEIRTIACFDWLDGNTRSALAARQLTAEALLDSVGWDLLARTLRNHLSTAGNSDTVLREILPAKVVVGIGFTGDPDHDMTAVVEALKASPAAGPDAVLQEALTSLANHPAMAGRPEKEEIRQAAEAVSVAQVGRPAPDPFDDVFLFNRRVLFLDRARLRLALRRLCDADGPLILSVTGPPQCGKTWTAELVKHLKTSRGFEVAYVSYDHASTPEEMVEVLRQYVAVDVELSSRLPSEDKAKWRTHAARWLVQMAKQREPGDWWFVIDGYRNEALNADVEDFIHNLARFVVDVYDTNMRLILLDYEDNLPSALRGVHENEPLRLFEKSDIREFFYAYFAEPRTFRDNGSSTPIDTPPLKRAHAEAAADEAWSAAMESSAANTNGAPLMELLRQTVEKVIESYGP